MKPTYKIFFASFLFIGIHLLVTSCVTETSVSTGVYYGPHRDPWFQDGLWMDGPRWHREVLPAPGVDIYIHPPKYRERDNRNDRDKRPDPRHK